MPNIRFLCRDGATYDVSAESGLSVMEAGQNAGVPGIIAECGGSISCGSCHVYVDPAFACAFAPAEEMELQMLEDGYGEWRATSRLSCQLVLSDAADGLVVEVAQNR